MKGNKNVKEKDSIIFYFSHYNIIKKLNNEQLGRLFRALFEKQLGNEVVLENDIEMAFDFINNQLLVDNEKYNQITLKRSMAGQRGGAPKGNKNACKNNQSSKTSKNKQNKLNDNENDNDLKETSLSRSKEKEEDFGKDVDKPLTELREELLSNQTWIETLSMNNHIDENESGLYIEAYIRKLQNEGIARKSVSDAQQHFARWLRIELKRARDEQSGIHQKPNSKTKQERYAEFAEAIAAKLAAGDTGNLQDGGESALPF